MLPRPDSQSFTKFLIWAGVFLLVAAIVVPGFILRDNGVLTIREKELREFSPAARQELERRQGIARSLGLAAPWMVGGFVLAGGFLLVFGLPRLRRQEKVQDERLAIELARLRAELEPQTPDEREERLRSEVAEDLEGEEEEVAERGESAAQAEEPSPELQEAPAFFPTEVAARAQIELQVLSRLSQIAAPLYDLQRKVKVPGSNLYLDALLVGQVDQVPDIVVAIKFVGRNAMKNVRNRITDAEGQLLRYMSRFRRQSMGWLILVAMDGLEAIERERIEQVAVEFRNVFEITVVVPEEISALELPIAK